MASPILEGMNPAQFEAITAGAGPVLVLAGPGSGKTRVLTHRIAYLIEEQHFPSHRIMAVTFTNKAAREMKDRVEDLIGEHASRVSLGTFHSICARILRVEAEHTPYTRDFVIYDSSDQVALVKQILLANQLDVKTFQPWSILSQISSAKNELVSPKAYPINSYESEIVQRVYEQYVKQLRQSNGRDFDDLLTHTVKLFQDNPAVLERYWRYTNYVLIDEFQDTNMAQYELIRLVVGDQNNIFVVGDPDQSIYAFRGADYRNVKRFQEDFQPRTIILDENYRSHQFILDAAMAVIRKNPDHIKRNLFSQRTSGAKIVIREAYNERDEAEYVLNVMQDLSAKGEYQLSDMAVLYRMNAQSRSLEETFLRAGMPYLLVGATHFYRRKEIKDVLAFLRVVHNPQDQVSLNRIINVPPRGIGATTLSKFEAWAETLTEGAWGGLQALARGEETPLSGRAKNAMTEFATTLISLRRLIEEQQPPLAILDAILDDTGYMEYLRNDRSDTGGDRLENIAELRRVAHEYEEMSLAEFLTELALVSDVDSLVQEKTPNAPTFLTLHAAKGLEFPVIFMVGMEEGILPHRNSQDDPAQLAEERRLMYVGVTRAKDRVYLIYTFRRMMFGYNDLNNPSRFLSDIPPEITTGLAQVPQSPPESPHYQKQWDTRWEPKRKVIYTFEPKAPVSRKKEPPSHQRFQSGQRVQHKVFGEGVVIKSVVMDEIEEVEVLFQQSGTKNLDASFLQPFESEG